MKSLFRNAAFWGVVVVTLLTSLPVWAQMTQTITLKSGTGGAVGSQDPANQFTPDGGATWQYAFVICPPCSPSNICNGVYNQIPGTQYISRALIGEGVPDFASTLYRTTFTLPAGFKTPSLTVQVYADNVATIFLNGTQIGQQPFVEYPPNFQGGPPSSFTTTEQSLFGAGVNLLEFEIYNYCCGTGFDYLAVVSFTPTQVPPASAASIAIENYSFEEPPLADGGYNVYAIPGWAITNPGGAGVWNPKIGTNQPAGEESEEFVKAIPQGDQVAWSNGSDIMQTLNSQLIAGYRYTLKVWVGGRVNYSNHPYAVILAGNSDSGAPVTGLNLGAPVTGFNTGDTWTEVTVTYDSPFDDPSAGRYLVIKLRNDDGAQVNFDKVTLERTPLVN